MVQDKFWHPRKQNLSKMGHFFSSREQECLHILIQIYHLFIWDDYKPFFFKYVCLQKIVCTLMLVFLSSTCQGSIGLVGNIGEQGLIGPRVHLLWSWTVTSIPLLHSCMQLFVFVCNLRESRVLRENLVKLVPMDPRWLVFQNVPGLIKLKT